MDGCIMKNCTACDCKTKQHTLAIVTVPLFKRVCRELPEKESFPAKQSHRTECDVKVEIHVHMNDCSCRQS